MDLYHVVFRVLDSLGEYELEIKALSPCVGGLKIHAWSPTHVHTGGSVIDCHTSYLLQAPGSDYLNPWPQFNEVRLLDHEGKTSKVYSHRSNAI